LRRHKIGFKKVARQATQIKETLGDKTMKKAELTALKALLIAAGENGTLVKQADANELVKLGFAEINTAVAADAEGKVPTRATAKLMAEGQTSAEPAAAAVTAPAKLSFDILSNIPVIDGQRGGSREEVYPFSQLAVGQSFLVPANEGETPKQVVERFSSTVSSATRRYSEPSATQTRTNKKGEVVPVNVPTRKFTLRPVTKGQTYPGVDFIEPADGARVYRTA
jgi:hypothetical protein